MRPGSDGILRRLRWPLVGIAAIFGAGLVGYLILGFALVDAITNTVLVMTTVGFNAPELLDPAEKLFTDAVAILGVSSYLVLLVVGVSALADGHFGLASRRRRMQRRVGRLRDHVVVCAYGRVGRACVRELRAAGARLVVVERQEALEEQMRADGVLHLVGDPTDEENLRRARVDRARAMISAVDSDADNVFITLTVRSLAPRAFIVARGSESAAADRLYRAGADRVISPYVSSGRHMARMALRPRILDYLEIRAGDGSAMRVEELVIEPGSHLVGARLEDVCAGATPLLVRHPSGNLVDSPPPDQRMAAGDIVVLLGAPDALRVAEEG